MPSWLWMAEKTNFKMISNYSLFIWNSNECGYVVFWSGSLPLGWWMSSRWGIGGRTEKTILGRDKLMDLGSIEGFSWWWRPNPQYKRSSHTHVWWVCAGANTSHFGRWQEKGTNLNSNWILWPQSISLWCFKQNKIIKNMTSKTLSQDVSLE